MPLYVNAEETGEFSECDVSICGVSWYRMGGVEEVVSHRMKGLGQPRFLSEDQERELTEEVRRWVEGRVYGSIEEKVEAVNSYLHRLESDPRWVRSLAGWGWIDEAAQSLPSSYAASSD